VVGVVVGGGVVVVVGVGVAVAVVVGVAVAVAVVVAVVVAVGVAMSADSKTPQTDAMNSAPSPPASENEVDYKSMYQSLLADHAREIEIADKLLRRLRENARAPDVGIELCNEVDSYLKERG
jgi:hypothetical protein